MRYYSRSLDARAAASRPTREEDGVTEEAAPPPGPDLAAGVAIAEIPDGGILSGRVGTEPVLLVRHGEDVFAVGATCTHYGGPLAEGLVVGDEIRCPWHHACFSLRTGEDRKPPALEPVASWDVRREGDRVRVVGKRPPPPRRASPRAAPESIVIVGAGPAGLLAARTVRREGYDGPVHLIGAEATPPVDRPNLSKDYLAGKAPEEWLPLRPPEFYAEQKIELVTGAAVGSLDLKQRRVVLEDGRSISYGALLLATGAAPVRLDVPGSALPHVHYLRTLADSRAIIAAAAGGAARRAVVVGSSFIGLEVAASLRERGVEVHVVSVDRLPLERILGPEVGRFILALHQSHGVVFHLGESVASIEPGKVTLKGGSSLPADVVVAGIGVRPVTTLAEKAGLRVDRGIVVDPHLETSAKGVFAAGDVARYPDPRTGQLVRIEHFVVAERQGQTAGRNLLGRNETYDSVPFFWSQHYDLALNYVGHAEKWDAAEMDGSTEERNFRIRYKAGDQVLAVLTLSRDGESLAAEAVMER
jgi:NADPH-dependent 2,4-dienoyl-CoA reductase/sulfur reductase-like enzyme/nitrite reductase/ring-hydroxylating ferredoxin subunit